MKHLLLVTILLAATVTFAEPAREDRVPRRGGRPELAPAPMGRPENRPDLGELVVGKLFKDETFLKELNVSEETVNKICSESAVITERIKATREKLRVLAKEQLDTAMKVFSSVDEDPALLFQKIEEAGKLKTELGKDMIRRMLVMRNYLNQEQLTAIKARMDADMEKMRAAGRRMGYKGQKDKQKTDAPVATEEEPPKPIE